MFDSPKTFFMKIVDWQAILTTTTMIFVMLSNKNIFSLIIGIISWYNYYFIIQCNKGIKALYINS